MRISRTAGPVWVLLDIEEMQDWADRHPGGGWHNGDAITITIHSPGLMTFACTRYGLPSTLDHVDGWALEELAQYVLSTVNLRRP